MSGNDGFQLLAPRNGQRGFTLLEVMVAMAIFTVGMLGVIGLQISAINGNRFGGHAAQALLLCEERAAMLASFDFDDSRLLNANTSNDPPSPGQAFASATRSSPDATAFADGYDANALDREGKALTAGFASGEGFTRFWQIADEDLNDQIAGNDTKRIQVVTRFRDGEAAIWREVAIIVLKTKAL